MWMPYFYCLYTVHYIAIIDNQNRNDIYVIYGIDNIVYGIFGNIDKITVFTLYLRFWKYGRRVLILGFSPIVFLFIKQSLIKQDVHSFKYRFIIQIHLF